MDRRGWDLEAPRGGEDPYVVLFVCTGNTCRSPMAEVAFNEIARRTVHPDGTPLSATVLALSAGTANWHVGSEMDQRARGALDGAGYVARGTTAVHATAEVVGAADLAVAMDRGHLADLRRLAPSTRSSLLLEWGPTRGYFEVTDPYYGSAADFVACLEVVEAACRALAAELAATLAPRSAG